jgi:hypothetical protein
VDTLRYTPKNKLKPWSKEGHKPQTVIAYGYELAPSSTVFPEKLKAPTSAIKKFPYFMEPAVFNDHPSVCPYAKPDESAVGLAMRSTKIY